MQESRPASILGGLTGKACFCILILVHSYFHMYATFFIPCHTIVAGYYGFKLDVHVSVCLPVCLSIFCFWMITWVNIDGFSTNLVCALILWRSGLGLLMGKFHQIFMEISPRHKMAGYYSLKFLFNSLKIEYWWSFIFVVFDEIANSPKIKWLSDIIVLQYRYRRCLQNSFGISHFAVMRFLLTLFFFLT